MSQLANFLFGHLRNVKYVDPFSVTNSFTSSIWKKLMRANEKYKEYNSSKNVFSMFEKRMTFSVISYDRSVTLQFVNVIQLNFLLRFVFNGLHFFSGVDRDDRGWVWGAPLPSTPLLSTHLPNIIQFCVIFHFWRHSDVGSVLKKIGKKFWCIIKGTNRIKQFSRPCSIKIAMLIQWEI